jgi:transaldolase
MNRIQELYALGQSIWLDFIERGMVQSGELGNLVAEGLAGVTSNPTIFQQAITKSDAYKDDLQRLVHSDKDPKTIFEELAVADIQAAADVLRPAYDRANGQDGFVSIEVAPDLAYDVEGTVAEAQRLRSAVNRPNLMVKVPATREGVVAIRRLIAAGLNINVTLIFGLERYAAVKEAFLNGLEDRVEQRQPIDQIASVASFFVSRVDSNIDGRLEKLAKANPARAAEYQALMGQIAVANAKLAYRQFQQIFSGPRWETLALAGAQVQRPLWASTSTKKPSYPELLYVDTLIGPHTVNTMPPKTLEAFRARGVVKRTIDKELAAAERAFDDVKSFGIDIAEVTEELEKEGVQKFADSYHELLAAIAQRRAEMVAA